jgi:hypothetical protein
MRDGVHVGRRMRPRISGTRSTSIPRPFSRSETSMRAIRTFLDRAAERSIW